MQAFWPVIGVALLVWVGYDIYAGYTVLTDVIFRATDPNLYWGVVSLWGGLGISCFFSWSGSSEDS